MRIRRLNTSHAYIHGAAQQRLLPRLVQYPQPQHTTVCTKSPHPLHEAIFASSKTPVRFTIAAPSSISSPPADLGGLGLVCKAQGVQSSDLMVSGATTSLCSGCRRFDSHPGRTRYRPAFPQSNMARENPMHLDVRLGRGARAPIDGNADDL